MSFKLSPEFRSKAQAATVATGDAVSGWLDRRGQGDLEVLFVCDALTSGQSKVITVLHTDDTSSGPTTGVSIATDSAGANIQVTESYSASNSAIRLVRIRVKADLLKEYVAIDVQGTDTVKHGAIAMHHLGAGYAGMQDHGATTFSLFK